MSALETNDAVVMLPSVPKIVSVDGVDIVIPRIKVKHLSRVLAIIRPFVNQLAQDRDQLNVLSLVADHTEDVVALLALMLDWDKEKVGELEIDVMVDLLSGLLEVNLDFFVQKVLPSLLGVMGRLAGHFEAQAKPRGPIQSNS